MAATDIAAKVRSAALSTIERSCFGEDFGVDASASLAQSATGPVVVYTLIVTTRSPLLGQGSLVHVTQIQSPDPSAEQIDQAVTQAMAELRRASSKILADRENAPALGGTFRP
jgi:hypothetical protein